MSKSFHALVFFGAEGGENTYLLLLYKSFFFRYFACS